MYRVVTFNEDNETESAGTGFYIRPNVLLTNYHAIREAWRIGIFGVDGKLVSEARVVNANAKIDVAFLGTERTTLLHWLTIQCSQKGVSKVETRKQTYESFRIYHIKIDRHPGNRDTDNEGCEGNLRNTINIISIVHITFLLRCYRGNGKQQL